MFQAMIVRLAITICCVVGLYVSLFMLRKSLRAARGEIAGPSVVKTPRAHLFGVPNSLLGAIYYPALAIAVWLVRGTAFEIVLLVVVLAAAGTSVALAYSLLFVTRRSCPYCWTSHVVNWMLLGLCLAFYLSDVLSRSR
jgi:uncharacterized membrane protein